MYGHQLQKVSLERDLGIHVSSDMKVGSQCMEAHRKASQNLGIINRIIRFKNPGILLSLCKSMVRPHLEFCSPAWNPYYIKDKHLLEKRVQYRFTRMFSVPYEDRLCKLGLWSLEERRNRADLLEIFRMVKGFSAVSWTQFFRRAQGATKGHNWKLYKEYNHGDIRQHSFSQRSINRWNRLSQDEVNAQTINGFKNCVQRRRQREMDFFMD